MPIKSRINIILKTANFTVLASNSNSHYSNEGAGALIIATLPAPEVGLSFGFFIENAFGISIVPTVGIRIGATFLSGVAGINSTDIGSFIKITCYKTGEWVTESIVGNWEAN